MVTHLVTEGTEVEIREVILPEDFGEFSLDSFAVINWNEEDGPMTSLLAHGVVDNITWEVPSPPLDRISLVGPGLVSLVSRLGWHYRLQASSDMVEWVAPLPEPRGQGRRWSSRIRGMPCFTVQFYRVEAQPE